MAIQIIIYSTATGRVRRVIDPQGDVADVDKYMAQTNAGVGESAMIHTKKGKDNIIAWQDAVTKKMRKTPINDRYCVIDAQNKIIGVYVGDPLCGDGLEGHSSVLHPNADSTWFFNGVSFSKPYSAEELANASAKGKTLVDRT